MTIIQGPYVSSIVWR